ARERLLAQVASNCADEVKRAKKVAEDAREKKAAELLRLKEDMREKSAEAERRRLLLQQQSQRRPRTGTLPSAEEPKVLARSWKPRNEREAAMVIQQAWRNRKRRRIVSEFLELGMNLENVQQTSFEAVGGRFSDENVLDSTAKLLRLYGLVDEDADHNRERIAARTFLSAFLVLAHPAQVLSKEGEQEADLIEKAKSLLLCLDPIITNPSSSPSRSRLELLAEVHASFQTAFNAWKDRDSSVLVETMLAQFVELDAIWQSVKNDKDGHVAEDYREGIQHNQTLLLARIKRLAGAEKAMTMIKEAIRKSRKANRSKAQKGKFPSGDARPRAASNPAVNTDTTALTPLEATVAHTTVETAEKRSIGPLVPDNRTLIHELAINKEYRIDTKPRTDMRDNVIQTISEKMRRGFESNYGDLFVVAMAEAIREKLLRLVAPGKSLYILISESLDTEIIANQVKMGSFSYHKFFSFMNSLLPKICAPVRDAEVKSLAEDSTEDPIERLAKLNYIIDLLSIDHANFTLQMNAPAMIKNATEYEQQCFASVHSKGPLVRTSQWWSRAKTRTEEEMTRRSTGTQPTPASRITPDKIYTRGLVDLTIDVAELHETDLPETLELDLNRLRRMRTDLQRIITISAILLTAKNLMRRDVRSQWKEQAQRMWDIPFENSQSFIAAIESRYALPPNNKTQLSGTIERILLDGRNRQATHPVVKVLLQKIKTHVHTRLSASSADERVKAASTASQVLSSSGLPEFVVQIGALIDELQKVAEVDREAHGKYYDGIIEQERNHEGPIEGRAAGA
ncbi:MAG: hypothetical protein Q9174_005926, partial [Haloplaca sp. 1 TL-2023]